MEITKGFYDLCIPFNKNPKIMKSLLTELVELGYRTIAIEQIFDHTIKLPKKTKDIFPSPECLDVASEFENKLRIFSRLTIIYSDVAVSHAMTNSANVKKFNIIAGLPQTEAAFNHCCSTFNGDIICFDPNDSKFNINRKSYQVAVKRNIFFEIKYSHAIRNSNVRKDMIKMAHNYHIKGKSRNIIFSSGADNIFQLRGPYDIANLALIFGLSEEQGKSSISSMCRQLCLRAESRRIGKTIMFARNRGPNDLSSTDESDDSVDEDDDDEMTTGNQKDSEIIKTTSNKGNDETSSTDDDDDDDESDETDEQPLKKSKLS